MVKVKAAELTEKRIAKVGFNHPMVKVKAINAAKDIITNVVSTTLW